MPDPGLASSMINTTAYSFAAQAYGANVEKVVSLLEGFVGIGITTGPILGSVVYQYLGFELTFVVFGSLMAPTAFMVLCLLPNSKEVKRRVMAAKNLQAQQDAD